MDFNKASYRNLKILVVGDIIVDETLIADVSRISPEAPVLVANYIEEKTEAGGAANVALNLVSSGAHCALMGFLGDDEKSLKVINQLDSSGVENLSICLSGKNAILKTRITHGSTQLIRVDRDQDYSGYQEKLINQLQKCMQNFNGIVVSDYGKGTITNEVFQEIVRLSKEQNTTVFVDPKGTTPQKYYGATVMTPNKKEFETFVGEAPTLDAMCSKGKQLIEDLGLNYLLVTLSEKGMLLIDKNGEHIHVPTAAKEIYDVTGAGDTVIAVFAATFLASQDAKAASRIANSAAGIVVGRAGAAKLTAFDFQQIVNHTASAITEIDELKNNRHKLGKLVMTNGCFDIIHKGHIDLLNGAKAMGDTLVVAMNSDESVSALKGSSRPINALEDRAHVVKNLSCVDFVVMFEDATPYNLYAEILPDILVKGGDYKISEIVGADLIIKNGGQVKILEYLDGYSTSNVINRIRNL